MLYGSLVFVKVIFARDNIWSKISILRFNVNLLETSSSFDGGNVQTRCVIDENLNLG